MMLVDLCVNLACLTPYFLLNSDLLKVPSRTLYNWIDSSVSEVIKSSPLSSKSSESTVVGSL
jgi:hypothetical protein